MTAQPFVKWVGGKTQLLPALLATLPSFSTYYEPFLGGGALFWALVAEGRIGFAVLGDVNRELVDTYRVVQAWPYELQVALDRLTARYNAAPQQTYREMARLDPLSILEPVERAARMILLNKTGFNGLYRTNHGGRFNVPWGKQEKANLYVPSNLYNCSEALSRHAFLTRSGYEETVHTARSGDLVYLDPPYVPAGMTSNFVSYTKFGFTLENHQRVANLCHTLRDRGVTVVASNSDTPLVRELYKGFEIIPVRARRSINCDATKRGPVGEVLILSYPAPPTLAELLEELPQEETLG